MDIIIKPLRRGGWSGRGLIATVQHGQLLETQVGPRQFQSEQAAIDWLHLEAAGRALEIGEITRQPTSPNRR